MYACMHICMGVCMYVCMYVCMCTSSCIYFYNLSKEVGKQYFRVTNDFYLVQLTMMKGGRSCNNT